MTCTDGSFQLPYDDRRVTFRPPSTWRVTRATPPGSPPPGDLGARARTALEHPVGGGRLRDAAFPGARVTLVVPDATRLCPSRVLVPLLLEELARGGVREEDVTVLVGLGMHRPTTAAERLAILGDFASRLRVLDASGADPDSYVDLGTLETSATVPPLPEPVPMRLHRRVTECDLLISTGVVEPHQYAGFSGGRKTVAIGCAGRETIGVLHGIEFLEHPGTRLGSIEGNPVHLALTEIARRAGVQFVVNVALNAEGVVIDLAAGAPEAVLETLVASLNRIVWTPVGREPFPVVLAGVGRPKDANLYQASRALTYLAFSPRPVLAEVAWVVLSAACPEGAGRGPGEVEFLERMRAGSSPKEVLTLLRRRGFGAGGQRAFMVAKALERFRCLVVGTADPEVVAACHMTSRSTLAEALDFLGERLGPQVRALVVEHALATLPTPDSPA